MNQPMILICKRYAHLKNFCRIFPGCILIVSHDRYFMDRLVDHLFAFEGNGEIKDFPGNYTQYRMWKQLEENKPQTSKSNGQLAMQIMKNKKPNPARPSRQWQIKNFLLKKKMNLKHCKKKYRLWKKKKNYWK